MKVYGYANGDETLLKMEEVTIQISASELEKIIEFFTYVKDLMKDNPETFGHEHLLDFCEIDSSSDIILIK